MRDILDKIENAAFKLHDLGEKAIAGVSDRLDDLKPAVGKAVGEAKEMFSKAGDSLDGIEHTIAEAKDAFSRAIDSMSATAKAAGSESDEVSDAPQNPQTPFEEIDSVVEAQLDSIRSARQTPGAFSDYIAKKFGKTDK